MSNVQEASRQKVKETYQFWLEHLKTLSISNTTEAATLALASILWESYLADKPTLPSKETTVVVNPPIVKLNGDTVPLQVVESTSPEQEKDEWAKVREAYEKLSGKRV